MPYQLAGMRLQISPAFVYRLYTTGGKTANRFRAVARAVARAAARAAESKSDVRGVLFFMEIEASQEDPIVRIAQQRFGVRYLYPYQRLVISNILESRDQIIILPTGAGKSLCFSLPALLLNGPTLIIFPLLALMADQARRLEETGHGVAIIRGGQRKNEREKIWRDIESGRVTYILSNPETLIRDKTAERLKKVSISHMVIDEAHTVSEWGESFRPAYLRLAEIRKVAGIPQVSAFTATASEYVLKRMCEIIFEDSKPHLVQAVPDRPNIHYSVRRVLSKINELRSLASKVQRPAIVFCRSRTSSELTSRILKDFGHQDAVRFYHAGLTPEEKTSVETWFFSSKTGILAATCAYGMGVDKKDIRTVIHRDLPQSVEAYLQESGRAGRDGRPAKAILLVSPEDRKLACRDNARSNDTAISDQRLSSLFAYGFAGARCRRKHLLSLLAAEPDMCFGCDICDGTADRLPPGLRQIVEFVGRYPRRFTVREASLILEGSRVAQVSDALLWRFTGFGDLKGWNRDEIEEAIESLERQKIVVAPKRGFWKSRLSLASKKAYLAEVSVRKREVANEQHVCGEDVL